MKSETGLWIFVCVLAVAIIFLFVSFAWHPESFDEGIRLSSLNGAVNICSDNSLTKALVCVSSNTEMIITSSSNVNELQHFIDTCPNHDVKIIDVYNCVGKTFNIQNNNGIYTVN